MSKPLVSVITPTYRRPHFLKEALSSIVHQTYENLQIIVRDNASGDETPQVVASFNDRRILFLQAERTGTADENGAECARHIRGEYFIPLCDDDKLSPNYIEILLRELEADRTILAAYGATKLIDGLGNTVGEVKPDGRQLWQTPDLIRAWCAGTIPLVTGINFLCPTWFFFDGLDERRFVNGHNADNAMFLRAGMRGKVLFTDECTFYYRCHATNTAKLSSFQDHGVGDKQFVAYLDAEVYSKCNIGLPLSEWPRLRAELKAMLAERYYNLFRVYRRHGGRRRDLFRGLILDPLAVYGFRNCTKCLVRQFRVTYRSARTKLRQTAASLIRRSVCQAQLR